MRNYSQPDFYHFTQDSIALARFISRKYSQHFKHALELGTGSGVISFELLGLGLVCESLSCIEMQYDFFEHFEFNRLAFAKQSNVKFIHTDFLSWETTQRFDLIFFNPPYYLIGEGLIPKDRRSFHCRFINRDAFVLWLEKSIELLSRDGVLSFCLNQQAFNRLDPIIKKVSKGKFQVESYDNCLVYFFSK